MYRRFIFFVLLLVELTANAEIVWLEKDYDFGLMKEEAGKKTGHARFINTGPEEICITGVRPSCGCTSATYPEEPLAPGDTATISFTYDPKGRPGRFAKTVRVYVGDKDTYIIRIKGNVLGTPESLSTLYPIENGKLRLSEAQIFAGEVPYGTTRNYFINGYNQSEDSITPVIVSPNHALTVIASEPKLGPGDIATYSFYFNSRKVPDMGVLDIPVKFLDNAGGSETAVALTANVTPDFSRLTPDEVKNGPRCYLLPDRIDLGIISSKAKNPKFKFIIKNEGETELKIMRVYSPSGNTKITKFPVKLGKGKTAEAEGELLLKGIPASPFNIKIEVITNDPLHPIRILHLVGQIE